MASYFTGELGAVGAQAAITANRGESVRFAARGTYAATFIVEREVALGGVAWERVAGPYSTADATVAAVFVSPADGTRYRVKVTAYTSGAVKCHLRTDEPDATIVPTAEYKALDISQKVTVFDDFVGVIHPVWSSTAGAGTANAAAAISAGSGGRITIKSASDDGTDAQNASNITMDTLDWKANQGGLVMETRLQLDAVTDVALFVGFTDTISTTVEMPIFLVAGDIDSTATDAVGVGFDTDGTGDDFWFHGGVANGTDTVPVYGTSGPTLATYHTIRVEVDAGGAVQGFVDGVAIGPPVQAAVTPTVALTPAIVVNNRGAAQRIVTVDYIWVQANR